MGEVKVRLVGSVKHWVDARGFGFVARDDGQPDVFVHIKDVATELDALPRGARVEFAIGPNKRTGKVEARDVVVISVSPEVRS